MAIDTSGTAAVAGVVGVITADDIPGINKAYDAPLLAGQWPTQMRFIQLHIDSLWQVGCKAAVLHAACILSCHCHTGIVPSVDRNALLRT